MPDLGPPVRQSFRVLGVYLRGQILLSLILAALYAAAFWAVHAPFWYLIAIAGGLFAVVPRLGALAPLALVIFALYADEAPLRRFFIALGLWLLIQIVSFVVLVPKLIHRPLGLRELPVIAAVLFASLLFGPLGVVIAVPALAVGLVIWRYYRKPARQDANPGTP